MRLVPLARAALGPGAHRGSLDQERRDASIRDLKAHLEHSRKLLETHAAKENHFLAELSQHLKKTFKRKEKQR